MELPGLLLVVSGPSGTGKGTVCKALIEKHPSIVYSVSATTRAPRVGEVDGLNYHFMSKEQFIEIKEEDGFVESAEVYGNYYGTPKKALLENLRAGKDVILEIDIQGAMQVKEKFPRGVFVFILPPSLAELKKRLVNRGTDTEEVITRRLKCAADEIRNFRQYNYIVINNKVEEAVSKIEAILVAEKHNSSRYTCVDNLDFDAEKLIFAPEGY